MPESSLLLDTHIVIWMATEPLRLPHSFRKAIDNARTRFVSHASAWEIQIKSEKNSRFAFSLDRLDQTMRAFTCTELPIEYADIRGLDRIHFRHRDPFDRLLMAQASIRSVPLVTLDNDIVLTSQSTKAFPLLESSDGN